MNLASILALIAELIQAYELIIAGQTPKVGAAPNTPAPAYSPLMTHFCSLGKQLAPNQPASVHPHIGAAATASLMAMMMTGTSA